MPELPLHLAPGKRFKSTMKWEATPPSGVSSEHRLMTNNTTYNHSRHQTWLSRSCTISTISPEFSTATKV